MMDSGQSFSLRSPGVLGMKSVSRPWLLGSIAGLVVASLVIAIATDVPAQGKKDPKKTDPKTKTVEPKEVKAGPPPDKLPPRVDAIDPAQGGVQHVTLIDDSIREGW